MNHTGLTLVEVLIVVLIMAILAVIVVPGFSDASQEARNSALAKDLQTLRRQIGLFKNQHAGLFPGQGGLDIAEQLTGKTDVQGSVTADGAYGPYLLIFPTNPFTETNTIEVGTGEPGGGNFGWYYNPSTGDIWPDDDGHKHL